MNGGLLFHFSLSSLPLRGLFKWTEESTVEKIFQLTFWRWELLATFVIVLPFKCASKIMMVLTCIPLSIFFLYLLSVGYTHFRLLDFFPLFMNCIILNSPELKVAVCQQDLSWNTWERLCINWVRSLSNMSFLFLGCSFKPRPNSHVFGTSDWVITIILSMNGCLHLVTGLSLRFQAAA